MTDRMIAETIEDKPTFGNTHACETGAWEIEYRPGAFDWYPLPFISAPTPDTEHIVLEWVKSDKCTSMQNLRFYEEVSKKTAYQYDVISHVRGCVLPFDLIMERHTLGDWARALLEVLTK